VQGRAKEIDHRREALEQQLRALIEQRSALAQQNRLRRRIAGFARRVRGALSDLSFEQRQKLVRLTVEEVRVAGCHVEIRLRIQLDQSPDTTPSDSSPSPQGNNTEAMSTNDRLRSLDGDERRQLQAQTQQAAYRRRSSTDRSRIRHAQKVARTPAVPQTGEEELPGKIPLALLLLELKPTRPE